MNNYHKEVKKVIIVVLVLNILMGAVKVGYGHYSGILSVSADGYESLLDSLANIIALIAVSLSGRPRDINHPYGYHKVETFASILIGMSLIVVSFQIISQAIDKFLHPQVLEVSSVGFIIMIMTLLVNIALSRYEKKKGSELKSDLLMADSDHTKSDVLVTSIVIFGLILVRLNLSYMDSVISILIALLIVKTGYDILKSNFNILLDVNIIPTVDICNLLYEIDGVYNVHNVRTRGTTSNVYVDLHLVVDSDLSIKDAYKISESCKQKLYNSYDEIHDVLINLESEEGLNDAFELK
ncbi:MAG: cation transporter [Methanosphaera stadtmanae]|nr:cation transporter [Methanosphaera stadtmanae]